MIDGIPRKEYLLDLNNNVIYLYIKKRVIRKHINLFRSTFIEEYRYDMIMRKKNIVLLIVYYILLSVQSACFFACCFFFNFIYMRHIFEWFYN